MMAGDHQAITRGMGSRAWAAGHVRIAHLDIGEGAITFAGLAGAELRSVAEIRIVEREGTSSSRTWALYRRYRTTKMTNCGIV